MSRVGKLPIQVPNGVQVNITGDEVVIKGKLGELKTRLVKEVKVAYEPKKESNDNDHIIVTPVNDTQEAKALWGTLRNIINNMVKGVSEGYEVILEIFGVGYRANVNGKILSLSLGYSHEIRYAIPNDITIKVDKQTIISITGASKQKVGQVAGELIRLRPVEPYKGKGVFKQGSYIRRKEGKKK